MVKNQKEIEQLAKKVAEGGRRLTELLLKAEDLHARSKALHRELWSGGIRAEDKNKNHKP